MPSKQSAPMLPSRKRQISAHAAAAGCSSLRGSNAAQLRTTEQARQRQRSGSTPHDPITADQRPLPDLFLLACSPPQPSSHSYAQFADSCTRKHPAQPTARSFAPTRSHSLHCKIISARVTFSACHCRSRAQIPIAFLRHRSPAAPPAHYLPTRFRALALFSRRSSEREVRSSLPAAENLHTTGLMHCSKFASLFDHLIGDRDQVVRDHQPERLGGQAGFPDDPKAYRAAKAERARQGARAQETRVIEE